MASTTLRFHTPRILLVLAALALSAASAEGEKIASQWAKIQVNFTSSADVVSQLKTLPGLSPASGLAFQAITTDNTILASGPEDQLRALKEAIRVLDVPPKRISLRAELVLSVVDRGGRTHRSVLSATGQTVNDRPVTLKTTLEGKAAPASDFLLTDSRYNVRVHPRINGDDTVTLDADWDLDCAWQAPGQETPFHLQTSSSGSERIQSGETRPLTSRTVEIGGAKSPALEAEVVLFLTPSILPHGSASGFGREGVTTVFLLDFGNRSGIGGEALARLAADTVTRELDSPRFEVLKQDEVLRYAKELGLHPPYDEVARSKLARALEASAVVTGEVAFVRIDTKSHPKTVRVGLKVREQDAVNDDLLSGGAQIGGSQARLGREDDEALTKEATENAAVQLVKRMLSYYLPEGLVLSTSGSRGAADRLVVLINRGSRDGVKEGMEMIVLRGGHRIGKIVITGAFSNIAEAEALDNVGGIRPEDRVRAVFPMPDFDVREASIRRR